MTKREKKQHKKRLRDLEKVEAEILARYGWLSVKELEFERRARNKALRLARKRKVRYIQ